MNTHIHKSYIYHLVSKYYIKGCRVSSINGVAKAQCPVLDLLLPLRNFLNSDLVQFPPDRWFKNSTRAQVELQKAEKLWNHSFPTPSFLGILVSMFLVGKCCFRKHTAQKLQCFSLFFHCVCRVLLGVLGKVGAKNLCGILVCVLGWQSLTPSSPWMGWGLFFCRYHIGRFLGCMYRRIGLYRCLFGIMCLAWVRQR